MIPQTSEWFALSCIRVAFQGTDRKRWGYSSIHEELPLGLLCITRLYAIEALPE